MFAQLTRFISPAIAGPILCFLFGACLVASAVYRVQKKLDPANKPTLWTYINELGGYFVLGIILVFGSLVSFINSLLGIF